MIPVLAFLCLTNSLPCNGLLPQSATKSSAGQNTIFGSFFWEAPQATPNHTRINKSGNYFLTQQTNQPKKLVFNGINTVKVSFSCTNRHWIASPDRFASPMVLSVIDRKSFGGNPNRKSSNLLHPLLEKKGCMSIYRSVPYVNLP